MLSINKNIQIMIFKNSLDVVSNHPYRLTEKWINSLNKWAKELMEKLALDEPDIPLGEKNRSYNKN